MRDLSLGRGFLLLSLLFVVSFCYADEQTFEVVGIGECADCKEFDFKTSQALSGLHVTIDCKVKNEEIKRIGAAELDESGKFKISLPQEIIQDKTNLKGECYAQLHSAAAIPCPAHNGLGSTKIVFKSQHNNKNIFGPTKTLQFSSALCTSKFLWPYFKYPPLPKTHHLEKNWPIISFPPLKKWQFPPFYKTKPLPPPAPVYKPKPKPPVAKPYPPPAPTYKPNPPVYKPPRKPLPPAAPVYRPKPKPPAVKPLPPPAPVRMPPPVVTKPLPPPLPLYPNPPFYKKPCPPFPKIPPKYFHHPKFGYLPPLPPFMHP